MPGNLRNPAPQSSPFGKGEADLFSGFVIPTEVEESLTVVWPWFDQKYLEMSPIRLAALAQGKLTEWRLRRSQLDATSRCPLGMTNS